jgi:hypothetical protein
MGSPVDTKIRTGKHPFTNGHETCIQDMKVVVQKGFFADLEVQAVIHRDGRVHIGICIVKELLILPRIGMGWRLRSCKIQYII